MMVIVVARVCSRWGHRGSCVGAGCQSCVVTGGGVVGLVGCRVTVNGLGEVVNGSNRLR